MTERREHEEFDRLLSGSGIGDAELAKLTRLARALERNRPALATPSAGFRDALRGKLLEEARTDVVIPLSLAARARATVAARNARARRSFRSVIAIAAAAAMMMVAGSAFAATAGSLPGQAGYPVKRFRERVQLAVAFSNVSKAQKQLDFARERLEEIRALKDAGIENVSLYTSTFNDMDASTTDATSRLIHEFRATENAGVLDVIVGFSQAQRNALESIFDQLPPGARPSARSSLELVVAVQDRVSDVLGGCPCSADVLAPSTGAAGSPKACTCTSSGTDSNGLPRRGTGSTSGGAASGPDATNPKTDNPQTPDGPAAQPSPLDQVTSTIESTVGDVIDTLSSLSPTPLPSLPPLLP